MTVTVSAGVNIEEVVQDACDIRAGGEKPDRAWSRALTLQRRRLMIRRRRDS